MCKVFSEAARHHPLAAFFVWAVYTPYPAIEHRPQTLVALTPCTGAPHIHNAPITLTDCSLKNRPRQFSCVYRESHDCKAVALPEGGSPAALDSRCCQWLRKLPPFHVRRRLPPECAARASLAFSAVAGGDLDWLSLVVIESWPEAQRALRLNVAIVCSSI